MKKLICFDCGKKIMNNEKDYYMVHDHIWEKFGVGEKFLCIDCLEKRMGRKLTKNDFTDFPVNKPPFNYYICTL